MVTNGNITNSGTITRSTVRKKQKILPLKNKNNKKSTHSCTTTTTNAAAILQTMHHDGNSHVSNATSANQSNRSKWGGSNKTGHAAVVSEPSTTPRSASIPVDQVAVAVNNYDQADAASTLTNSVANPPWNPTKDVLETTVSNFARESIWPFFKFINGKDDPVLDWSSDDKTSLCWFVCDKLSFQEAQRRDLWHTVKPVIVRTITAVRNSKIMAMRTVFMSKLLSLVVKFSCFLSNDYSCSKNFLTIAIARVRNHISYLAFSGYVNHLDTTKSSARFL